MKAIDARLLAESFKNSLVNNQLKWIMESVEGQARAGKLNLKVVTPNGIHAVNIKELKSLGYAVNETVVPNTYNIEW